MKQTQTEKVTLHSQGGDEMNVIYKKIKRIGNFIKHTGVYNHCVCDDVHSKFGTDQPTKKPIICHDH